VVSETEAFKTGINARDGKWCIVCGLDNRIVVEHAHIIPEIEIETARSDIPHSTHQAEMDAVRIHA
jgi:hypothetical protein